MSSNHCTEKKFCPPQSSQSSKSTSVNVREGNFDDEVRVTWILVRTSTEHQQSIFRLPSYMADINSNKNAIIIQPITLQIRAFSVFDQSESDKAYALF